MFLLMQALMEFNKLKVNFLKKFNIKLIILIFIKDHLFTSFFQHKILII